MTSILKGNTLEEQIAEDVLREYLIRSYTHVSSVFPEVKGIAPENAADFLIHLRKTGRIKIELFSESPSRAGCRIIDLAAGKE